MGMVVAGVLFQSAANDGAGTIQLANLAGDAPLPKPSLGSFAGDAAEQVAEYAGAEHNADKGTDAEIDLEHPSILRSLGNRRPKIWRFSDRQVIRRLEGTGPRRDQAAGSTCSKIPRNQTEYSSIGHMDGHLGGVHAPHSRQS
jgi:hypothetical protein